MGYSFSSKQQKLVFLFYGISAFVINLSKRGMTGKQISMKTGIPVSEVLALLDKKK
jgi:hypothetical protein